MRFRTLLVLPMLTGLLLTGCAGTVVKGINSSCSALIPVDWFVDDGGPALPAEQAAPPATATDRERYEDALKRQRAWAEFAVIVDGQRIKMTARGKEAVAIIARCEMRDEKANARLNTRRLPF